MRMSRGTGGDGAVGGAHEARGAGRLASSARALLLAACVCACGPPDPLAPRPRASVVLISIDTLRADHLGCYGFERPTSPHLDEFARGVVLFERALSASNNTAPSHMTLLSGVSPAVHALEHRELRAPPASIPMLAEILHASGYRTLGMADGGFVTPELGFARGFDTFESRLQPFKHKLPELSEWIARGCAEPTFLFVHTYDVHSPYVPPVEFDRFTDPDSQGPFRTRLEKFREAFEKPELIYTMGALHSNFWEDDMDHLTPSDLT